MLFGSSGLSGPGDNVILQCAGTAFANAAPCGGSPCTDNGFCRATDQWMPQGQTAPFGQAAISTVRRKPVECVDHVGCQGYTILHFAVPVWVILALTGFGIEQPARDRCIMQFFRVIIAQFVQAAATAAVAQGFHSLRVISARAVVSQNGREAVISEFQKQRREQG